MLIGLVFVLVFVLGCIAFLYLGICLRNLAMDLQTYGFSNRKNIQALLVYFNIKAYNNKKRYLTVVKWGGLLYIFIPALMLVLFIIMVISQFLYYAILSIRG